VHQSAPHMYAIIIEALGIKPGDHVLNVGSGTGYLSTMFAWFAGADGVNHGVEQYECNVAFAREHAMSALESINNVAVPLTFFAGNIFNLDTASNILYDRIYVGANCAPSQVSFFHALLKDGGVLLVPSDGKLLRQTRRGAQIVSEAVLGVRFAELSQPGSSDSNKMFTCLTRTAQAELLAKREEQERVGRQLTRQASIDASESPAVAEMAAVAIGGVSPQTGFVTPLCALLREHGLENFYPNFEAEQVTLENVKYLDAASLKQMDIPLGPRMHLLSIFRGETGTEGGGGAAAAPPPPPAPPPAPPVAINMEKYIAGPKAIRLGQPEEAAHGLADMMGVDDATIGSFLSDPEGSIIREFTRSGEAKDRENLRKVLHAEFDDGLTLDLLVEHDDAKRGRLRRHHVLALRMYTTSSYVCFNGPLRTDPPARPHPFAASVYFASEAIKKLRAVAAHRPDANDRLVFWRGMKDLTLTMEFLTNGGTEFACMSTSKSDKVAESFAKSKCPLIFKFETTSFMTRGADIGFLSVYPGEEEFLYPPLTFLRSIEAKKERIGDNGELALVATVEPIFPS
jgi:protein-L-isoaspartate O-methyltransferase